MIQANFVGIVEMLKVNQEFESSVYSKKRLTNLYLILTETRTLTMVV